MSAGEGRGERGTRYGTIVVVGGGCYGSYYVRQLLRAREAGALGWDSLIVVDRDAGCRVARETGVGANGGARAGEERRGTAWGRAGLDEPADAGARGAPPEHHDGAATASTRHPSPAPHVEIADWTDFFRRYLGRAAADPAASARDAIVPSPLMPHLLFEWLLARAGERWPDRGVGTEPLASEPELPWQRRGADGTHYVSFATWMCPVNCIEPARCPRTRGERSWSLPPAVRAYAAAEERAGRPLAGPVIFHCTHRAYGVGMVDVRDAVAADQLVSRVGAAGPARVLVGTVSHCHGALGVLRLGAPGGHLAPAAAAR